ncbi:hypothetical protein BJ508DRAFT_308353 [Ascobolus immersus RN42]|uniref:Uncharacterized protein n=1 Tax=Ascobolus immersus RN42 TaxID=1160509 RepID=A0A3N4I5P8_ASCIM|nr:hypothetical protein BJ508DRAFT_308353 [Ascobolus immersus RN42]
MQSQTITLIATALRPTATRPAVPCLVSGLSRLGTRLFHQSRPTPSNNLDKPEDKPLSLQQLLEKSKRPDMINLRFDAGHVAGAPAPRMPRASFVGIGTSLKSMAGNLPTNNVQKGSQTSQEKSRPDATIKEKVEKAEALRSSPTMSVQADVMENEPSLEDLMRRTKGNVNSDQYRLLGPRTGLGMALPSRPSSFQKRSYHSTASQSQRHPQQGEQGTNNDSSAKHPTKNEPTKIQYAIFSTVMTLAIVGGFTTADWISFRNKTRSKSRYEIAVEGLEDTMVRNGEMTVQERYERQIARDREWHQKQVKTQEMRARVFGIIQNIPEATFKLLDFGAGFLVGKLAAWMTEIVEEESETDGTQLVPKGRMLEDSAMIGDLILARIYLNQIYPHSDKTQIDANMTLTVKANELITHLLMKRQIRPKAMMEKSNVDWLLTRISARVNKIQSRIDQKEAFGNEEGRCEELVMSEKAEGAFSDAVDRVLYLHL